MLWTACCVALLCIAVLLTALVMLVTIPDGNDLALTHLDKHARLESMSSRKIVFIGGSNLLYGLDSAAVQHAFGLDVVNMGLNGYLGPIFILNEVKDELRRGDIVVVSLEYEAYFEPTPYYSIEGAARDQLMLVKLRPASLRYVETFGQYRRLLKATFEVAQAKVVRIFDEWLDKQWGREPDVRTTVLLDVIERRAGVNEYGDLLNHLGVEWLYVFKENPDLSTMSLSEPLVRLLDSFSREMAAKGVLVTIAPPPAPHEWYEPNRAYIESAFERINEVTVKESTGVLGHPAKFVWPRTYFFDNANHLTAEGRALRTQLVIADLHTIVNRVLTDDSE